MRPDSFRGLARGAGYLRYPSQLTPSGGGWNNPTMIVTMDSKRRLTIPASLAPASPGEYFDARFDPEEDAIVFRRLAGKGSGNLADSPR